MMRDMGMRIVHESDKRLIARRTARSFQTGFAPRKQTCSLWPRVVWATCLGCKQTVRLAQRGGSYQSAHDVWYCHKQREMRARES